MNDNYDENIDQDNPYDDPDWDHMATEVRAIKQSMNDFS